MKNNLNRGLAFSGLILFSSIAMSYPLNNNSVPLEVQRLRAKANKSPAVIAAPQPVPQKLNVRITRNQLPPPKRHLKKVIFYSGSLKTNIQRVARQFGWNRVVWKVPNDYRWEGTTSVNGASLPRIFTEILQDYPLQAVFYQGNHVLAIVPRTLRT